MAPNRYTELFFHDEAVALAAGHRPCGECRQADYLAFLDAAGHEGKASAFDAYLHEARAVPRLFQQRRHRGEARNLPDGAFVLMPWGAGLLLEDRIYPFSPEGYGDALKRPEGMVTVLTPEPTLKALQAGFRPKIVL